TVAVSALPPIARASPWASGAAMRHRPHHAARKSVSTGTLASAKTCENELSSTSSGSFIGGSGALQFPQRPVSERRHTGTRLPFPQFRQLRIMEKPALVSTLL